MVKNMLIILISILIHTSLAAMNSNTKPIPPSPTQEQARIKQWEELQRTPEFRRCIELIIQGNDATREYEHAFENLTRTNAYQECEDLFYYPKINKKS